MKTLKEAHKEILEEAQKGHADEVTSPIRIHYRRDLNVEATGHQTI